MDQIPCPDGYLLDARSPLAEGHHALNQYLVRVEEAGWQTAIKEVNAIRNKALKLAIWKALLERIQWLRHNSPNSSCWSPFRGLTERIEKWTLDLKESDLIELMERTAEIKGAAAPYTPAPHLIAYVEANGLTPELARAIQSFRDRVWEQSYTPNQMSLQLFRSRLDMLCWRDEWNAIDTKRCWSEQIRADFRSMRGEERENWRRLLHSIHGDEGVRPAPRWLSSALATVEGIGPQSFRERLLKWFQTLQPGTAQKLSREGSYLLRTFIWLAEAAKDPALLAKLEDISEVEFKPKANGQKVIRAASEAIGKPDPTVKPMVAPAINPDLLISRALQTVLSPVNSLVAGDIAARIELSEGIVHVRGDLDSYQVHTSNGAIYRTSDGSRVHIANAPAQFDTQIVSHFGGFTELFGNILILASDSKHQARLTFE